MGPTAQGQKRERQQDAKVVHCAQRLAARAEVSLHRLSDAVGTDRYGAVRAIGRPKPVGQALVPATGVTAAAANGQALFL